MTNGLHDPNPPNTMEIRIKKVLTEEQERDLQDAIDSDSDLQAAYAMLHEFRNWNRNWALVLFKDAMNVHELAIALSRRYKIIRK
jgi:hypothetical protein